MAENNKEKKLLDIVDPIFGSDDAAALAGLYKETGSNIIEKQAMIHRRHGVGKILQRQQNFGNVFNGVIDLWSLKKAKETEKFNSYISQMEQFDDSKTFGNVDWAGQVNYINDECESLITQLSKMDSSDEGYKELTNQLEGWQTRLMNLNDVNKKLLEIRNLEKRGLRHQWSANMGDDEIAMWEDLMTSNGDNITFNDDYEAIWTNPGYTETQTTEAGGNFLNMSSKNKLSSILDAYTYNIVSGIPGVNEITTEYSLENMGGSKDIVMKALEGEAIFESFGIDADNSISNIKNKRKSFLDSDNYKNTCGH